MKVSLNWGILDLHISWFQESEVKWSIICMKVWQNEENQCNLYEKLTVVHMNADTLFLIPANGLLLPKNSLNVLSGIPW